MTAFDPYANCPHCSHLSHVGIECRAPSFSCFCACVAHVKPPSAELPSPAPKKKRRKASTSPSARTLKECKRRGWLAGVVERRNPHLKHVTHDLFGFVDIVAVNPLRGCTVLIQATADANHMNKRQRKIEGRREEALEDTPETPKEVRAREAVRQNALTCLKAGLVIEVWGWRKLKAKRGGKKVTWEVLRRRAVLGSITELNAMTIEWEDVDA